MLIWDIIRDWFVQYIFGGEASNGTLYQSGFIGSLLGSTADQMYTGNANEFYIPIKGFTDGIPAEVHYIALSDWLSTTATLIVIIAVCFGLFMLVRYFFRMFSGLLSFR